MVDVTPADYPALFETLAHISRAGGEQVANAYQLEQVAPEQAARAEAALADLSPAERRIFALANDVTAENLVQANPTLAVADEVLIEFFALDNK